MMSRAARRRYSAQELTAGSALRAGSTAAPGRPAAGAPGMLVDDEDGGIGELAQPAIKTAIKATQIAPEIVAARAISTP